MKRIKKFNKTKKTEKVEKVKDQEVLFNVEVLVDKDEKPSFKTEVEDQEKLKKEFDKLRKIKNFENFTIEIEVGCGCCNVCTGQSDCDCCQDCTCCQSMEEQPRVMNITDFIKSIDSK